MKYYWFAHGEVASVRATISRTGYTGEDGFEIFVPPQSADRVWQAILEAGAAGRLIPCGLGARDTLRLEAGMRLYGNDIDDTTTAVEADLDWIVGWKKDDFIGADVLREQKANGVRRKLVGFEMIDRGIARHGYDAYVGDAKAGARHERHADAVPEEGDRHGVRADRAHGARHRIRRRHPRPPHRARVVPMPFYKRESRRRDGVSRPASNTPKTTNGSSSRATAAKSASPTTRSSSSATSSTSSCPRSAPS